MTKPKILYVDIETAPNVAFVWGKWEQDVIKFLREWYMLSFSFKWNDGRTQAYTLADFTTFKKDKYNDRELVKKLWELFNEADIIVAHNGDRFDIKKANSRFLFHKLPPPSSYKTIDTLKIAKKYFSFNSNRLDDLGALLGIGRKASTDGFKTWEGCMEGDMKAWKIMTKYNKQDVDLLYDVYLRLRSWTTNHPNVNLYSEEEGKCPICGGTHLQKRGFGFSKMGKYQRYQCQDCAGWSKDRKIIKLKTDITQ